MAYINLLPPEDRKKRLDLRYSLILIGIIFYIFLLLGVHFINQYQIKQLMIESASIKNQIQILQPTLERIRKMEDEEKELQSKIKESKSLDKRTYFSSLLVFISELIPEGVKLTRLNYNREIISYEGEAVNYRNVADFIANLKSSGYFKDVELLSSYINDDQTNSIGFKITARLNIKG
ncbi:hypothetical protein BBF96_14585 [Anoxybacter fermentans]|uniref:Fimbrial assembly protein n=1 Tax=Anoxybacter fermentans TaxID=1323375 RepID=A0A3Q9HSQ0_9FIRM|nr:PilN domain-containing protein [Anoxybacter fermentans]AZR74504.1 hypothetical protein BBF96_14585 [Anoxybacter fermentans]